MKSRLLPVLMLTLALGGIGCSSAKPVEKPTIQEAYTKSLSGTVGNAKLDLSLTTAFKKVRGSFTYTENGASKSGLAFGSVTGTDQLVFGLYTGRWDDFAAVTGTWQGDTLVTRFTLTGKEQVDTELALTAAYEMVTATGSDKRIDGTERCTFNFAYPVMHIESVDAAIRKDFGLGSTSTPQMLSDEFISRCKTDIEDLLSDTTTADYAKDMTYDSETLFSVERNRDGIVSFLIDSYDFEGGAHGMPGMYGVNVDLETGKSLSLGDLMKRDQLKPFLQRVESRLLADYAEGLFEEPLANFKEFTANKEPASEDELVAYAGLDNFYLTDTDIVFYWNVYEISPYAGGQLTVEIPFSEIGDMIRSDAPGSSLIQ